MTRVRKKTRKKVNHQRVLKRAKEGIQWNPKTKVKQRSHSTKRPKMMNFPTKRNLKSARVSLNFNLLYPRLGPKLVSASRKQQPKLTQLLKLSVRRSQPSSKRNPPLGTVIKRKQLTMLYVSLNTNSVLIMNRNFLTRLSTFLNLAKLPRTSLSFHFMALKCLTY